MTDPATTVRLLDRAREGDRDALDALFARHRGRLGAMIAARLPAAARFHLVAEDLVQEVHLEAARRLADFEDRGPSSFYRWLTGIARNKIREAVRAGMADKRARAVPMEHDLPSGATTAGTAAVRTERAARLAAAIDGLSGDQGEAVRLRYLEGMSIAETAERMERSPAAVKMLVSRGLGALALRLRPSG